ncbi:flavin-containing monooxygenase [Aspergillus ruber CBS 135680]|uniref:FAD/NAD(P)-binding domain-containing protein n=1 Tax=Aspergillus ruber (strain CBS 135680) TaxID=1388766 RepID=A0A017S8G9_ASPRC|nr:FAD/NAD(P)-binding domain-containing protein [Aspergillus ruber CBS 135680]EYE93066.1 FAD/NAD(P)-binding domain-containing protein [Aspergillus ruber CBS 135680]
MGSISPFPKSHGKSHCNNEDGSWNGYRIRETRLGTRRPAKVILMGISAAGIDFAHSVVDKMDNPELQIYEKNSDIGGTWLENRYPGCACGVPSVSYQYIWQRKPDWSRYFSGSREIWQYFKNAVRSNQLKRFVKFNHQVIRAEWLDSLSKWKVTIMCDNDPRTCFDDYADFLGLNDFQGVRVHSANWDDNVQLDNKPVLAIGVGSSAVQIVPTIIDRVQQLHVVARSPTCITAGGAPSYAGPGGANFTYIDETKQKSHENPELYLRYCKAVESELNIRFRFIVNGSPESQEARTFCENFMRQKLVKKPGLIDKLISKNFGVGCRHPTSSNGFLEALTEDRTSIWTENIREITETGFVSADGQHREVDVIICATGFDTTFCPRFPLLQHPRYEDYDIEYLIGNRFNYLGNEFAVRDHDGRNLTWYYGLVNGEDRQSESLPPTF